MAFFLRTFIKYLLLPVGIVYSLFNKQEDEILILMYHRVNDNSNKELAVSRRNFYWHMSYLYKKGFNIITMDEVCSMISGNTIKGKNIVITFDDGYLDYYTNAYPILKRYKFPSITYLCPGYIGTCKKYQWDRDEENAPVMDWQHIHRLNSKGLVEFGSHTVNHVDMDKLDLVDIDRELKLSKYILEKKLGRPIRHFAYPRGIYSGSGEEILKRYYDTAVLISNGKPINRQCGIEHIYTLKRIPVLKSDGKYLFAARLKGWLAAEEFARNNLDRLRIISSNILHLLTLKK